MIEAVIFDMDGLLIDSEDFWQEEEKRIFASLGIDITPEMHKETYGLGTNEVIKHWYNYKPWKGIGFDELRTQIFECVGSRIEAEGRAMLGVEYIFDYFAQKPNLKFGLASASPMNMIQSVLKKLNLRDKLQVVHSCEYEDYEKPHPAIYISTAKMLGVLPQNCLVFEDSLVGLIAAKAARMKTISIPHAEHADNIKYSIADIKLNNLKEFNDTHFNHINKLI